MGLYSFRFFVIRPLKIMSLRPAQWINIIGNMSLVALMRVSLLSSKANRDLLHREFRNLETSEENFTHVNDKIDVK